MVADWLLQVRIAVRIRYYTRRGGYLIISIEEDVTSATLIP